MGRDGFPVYGEDLGSSVENIEKVIEKIKTNKFDKKDLMTLAENAFSVFKYAIEKDED